MRLSKNISWLILVGTLFIVGCEKEEFELGSQSSTRNITANSVDIVSTIFVTGSTGPYTRGINYSTTSEPPSSVQQYSIGSGTGDGNFTVTISGLTPNTTYYVRPYVTQNYSTYYGTEISFTTTGPGLGIGPAGGQIFYDDGNGGGMEVYPVNWTTDWGCTGIFMSGLDTIVGSGASNTDTITSNCLETEVAALYCANYSIGGYDDWYLPSLHELELVYQNAYALGYISVPQGVYHSSSQVTGNQAYGVSFWDGATTMNEKIMPGFQVLPIRTF